MATVWADVDEAADAITQGGEPQATPAVTATAIPEASQMLLQYEAFSNDSWRKTQN